MMNVPAPSTRRDEGIDRLAIRSTDLFQGEKELVIRHRGEEYRLRITRNGKLILTK